MTAARGTMNPERAAKIAARKIGVAHEEYVAQREAGKRWCYRCRAWCVEESFGIDRSRSGGRNNVCKACIRSRSAKYNAARVGSGAHKTYYTGGRRAHSSYAEIRKLEREGLTRPKIAERLGCSYWSVCKTLFRARDPEGYRQYADQQLARLANRPRSVSLDQRANCKDGSGSELYEYVRIPGSEADDPADVLIHDEAAAALRRIVGDMAPEDVQRMTSWDLERLRDRLADAGLVPRGVQGAERDRLRDPQRKTGEFVKQAKSGGGGKRGRKAQQQVTRDHHVRELSQRQKQAHKQRRRARREEADAA